MSLHLLGGFDAQQVERGHQLPLCLAAQAQQEIPFRGVGLGKNVMPVIEEIKALRQLEGVFG